MMTDAQTWLREHLESDDWRSGPQGVWTARQLIQVIPDHTCGDGGWCAFTSEGSSGGHAQRVDWDSWEQSVREHGHGEELNPRLEYPTAPPLASPPTDEAEQA